MTQKRKLWAAAAGAVLLLVGAGIVVVKFGVSPAEEQLAPVAVQQSVEALPPLALEPAPAPTVAHSAIPVEPARLSAWRPIGTWTGDGSSETERFTTAGSEWRITWRTTGDPRKVCALGIYVYDSAGTFVALAALRQGVGSDTSYVRAEPGEYYLSVISCASDWEIAVEDRS